MLEAGGTRGAAVKAILGVLSLMVTGPLLAQEGGGDSLAVIHTVQRYYTALERGDTAGVFGLLSPRFVYLQRGEIRTLAAMRGEDGILGLVRWRQQTARGRETFEARVSAQMAYAWTTAEFQSRSRPDLFKGIEVELIILVRSGPGWRIEAIHTSLRDRE
jgi:hypothetical protein